MDWPFFMSGWLIWIDFESLSNKQKIHFLKEKEKTVKKTKKKADSRKIVYFCFVETRNIIWNDDQDKIFYR